MAWLVLVVAASVAAPIAVAGSPAVATADNAGVHQPAVDALRDRFEGIFDGTGCDDGLCPDEPLQRWEMAVWLIRVLDQHEPPDPRPPRFDDVGDGIWWAAHTERLAELGVTVGCRTDPLRYCPHNTVTRGQMAAFLVRAFGLPPGPPAGFTDVATDNVFATHIDALAAAGVTAGCATQPDRYCPNKPVTRAQMATFLARASGIIETPRPPSPNYTAVAAGGFHTCALATSATIDCWGNNGDGQADPPAGTHTAVAAGGFHTCALATSATIDCWGNNGDGQADPPAGTHTAVAAGGFHTCALATSATIDCWGYNGDGQADPPAGTHTAITTGRLHTCAIATNQTITCWGNNDDGQSDPPAGTYTAVAAGGFHTCALATSATIDCWGYNGDGQADPPAGTYTAVAAGGFHTCALATSATITCWGNNTTNQTNTPTGTHTTITTGTFHSCALTPNNTTTCWGNNENRQTNRT